MSGGVAADWSIEGNTHWRRFSSVSVYLRQCCEWTALFPRFFSHPWSQGDVWSRSAEVECAPPVGCFPTGESLSTREFNF